MCHFVSKCNHIVTKSVITRHVQAGRWGHVVGSELANAPEETHIRKGEDNRMCNLIIIVLIVYIETLA